MIIEGDMNELPAEQNTPDTSNAQSQPGSEHPIVLNPSKDKKRTPQARKHYRRRKFRKAPIWIEAGCAIALVVITGFYTHYAHQQVQTAQNTLGEIIKQFPEIQKSANAANRAATIAGQALQYTQAAFRDDQRAWVYASAALTFNPPNNIIEIGKPFVVRVALQNSGKTPAPHVSIIGRFIVKNGTVDISPESPKFPNSIPKVDYSKYFPIPLGIMDPSQTGGVYTDVSISPRLTQADYDRLMSYKKTVFVFGKISYCDVSHRQHWTTYCFHLLAGGDYAACDNSNDMDEDEAPSACAQD